MSDEVEKKLAMIPEEIFNAIVDYLVSKPYGEVFQIVDAIKVNVQVGQAPSQENEEEDSE